MDNRQDSTDTETSRPAKTMSLSAVKQEQDSESAMVDPAPPGKQHTPKKTSHLRDGSVSRASSIDRSSPVQASSRQQSVTSLPAYTTSPAQIQAQAPAPAPQRKRSLADPPKGIAIRKPTNKKRKLDANGSGTSSESKKPKKKPAAKARPSDRQPTDLFCICRTADDHTWMIACDGGCEDWFHGKCVKIDEADSELIDKYICPACEKREGKHTTFKPMCRYPGCRKPARIVDAKAVSKYCSDEHGVGFMRLKLHRVRLASKSLDEPTSSKKKGSRQKSSPNYGTYDDDTTEDEVGLDGNEGDELGARGGVLSASELKSIVDAVRSASEFRNLGSEKDAKAFINMDLDELHFTTKEREHSLHLRGRLATLCKDLDRLRDRDRFLTAIRHHAKVVSEYVKTNEQKGTRGLCLFDSRLSWSDAEFDEWRSSSIGRAALDAGLLPETSIIQHDQLRNQVEDYDPKDPVGNLAKANATKNLCLKRRKCERHYLWSILQQEDTLHETRITRDAIKKIEADISDTRRRVFYRVATGSNSSAEK
ncbi:hypothetical protein KEM54_000691 [Ascosphaera aggregata]|nr:hypothetical protein KEM54_000691 [Ascosphaera aggregata]